MKGGKSVRSVRQGAGLKVGHIAITSRLSSGWFPFCLSNPLVSAARLLFFLLITQFLGFVPSAAAGVDMNIYSSGVLMSGGASQQYTAVISDCTAVHGIHYQGGDTVADITPDQTMHIPGSTTGCRFNFLLEGAGNLEPSITLKFADGTEQTYSESFWQERNLPSLEYTGVRFVRVDGQQYLQVTATASDDVDLSYVSFSIQGFRASDLRENGGVLARAAEHAFVDSQGAQRVYPLQDGQTEFTYTIKVKDELSAEEIAHDGVVVVNIAAVDASGNQRSTSEISFTGSDVKEQANGLTASPDTIIFTNLLETATIIPTVDFQFRGQTPLPGMGSGVTYQSSRPDLIAVTTGGIVYPLAETNGAPVTITVSYPDLPSVEIPVEVDLSKKLVALKVKDGLNEDGQWVLPRLNTFFKVPELVAVFDDGSEAEIGSQFQIDRSLPEAEEGFLTLDSSQGLLAKSAISATNPVALTLKLHAQPDISVQVPVVAVDALPGISLSLPSSAKVGTTLELKAEASDDVGVGAVTFYMDGSEIGTRSASPYTISLDITNELLDRELEFKAVAVDTAGQENETAPSKVKVVAEVQDDAPDVQFELPVTMQRCVEGSPIRYQIAVPLGDGSSGSNITYVEYYLDGSKVGEVSYPLFETRPTPDGKSKVFEIWRLDSTLAEVSTDETSLGIYALVHTRSGGKKKTPSRLIRILANSPPEVKITSPVPGASLSVGQRASVDVEFADDTLGAGVTVELYRNGEKIDQFYYKNDDAKFSGSFDAARENRTFTFPVTQDMLGQTVQLYAKATDMHGTEAQTEVLDLPVHADQPPSVAITYPVDGKHFVAGLPIEIRAQAADDVRVDRVDFYVEGKLVASDSSAPYSCVYHPVDKVETEQPLTMYAVVHDSAGQTTQSRNVVVTLGKDEQPPVINFSSPAVNATDGGESLARVVADSEIVVKATGYDDVEVARLVLHGVKAEGSGYVLTGNENDVLDGDKFAPQQIPGAIHAFSALKLVHVPLYSNSEGVEYDRYPLEVTAYDKEGNHSTASIVVAVGDDKPPVISRSSTNIEAYFGRDEAVLEVQAKDDRAVTAIDIDYFVDGATTSSLSQHRDVKVPGTSVGESFVLNLADLGLANTKEENGATVGIGHTIAAKIVATDSKGQHSSESSASTLPITVKPDLTGPLAAISTPVQGSTLYQGEMVNGTWKARDESPLASIQIMNGATQVFSKTLSGQTASGSFSFATPASGDELVLTVVATDVFGNRSTTNWRFQLLADEPPKITIRAPAQGSRLEEGESFTLQASITDNRSVASATFYIKQGATTLFQKTIAGSTIEAKNAAGEYVSVGMRTPHRPEAGEPPLEIGVRAVDNKGLTSTELLDLDILDDLEPPRITMDKPAQSLEVIPGESFAVAGKGDDNFYIEDPVPVLVDADGKETILDWKGGVARNDRVETVKVANPDSFGTAIVGRRFFTEFSSSLTLPDSYLDHVGETYTFFLRARDRGYNTAETGKIQITILPKPADKDAPEVTITQPGDTVVEQHDIKCKIAVRDNVELASYKVYLDGSPIQVLKSATDVGKAAVSIDDVDIAVGDYDYQNTESNSFVLVVEAEDTAGNHVRKIQPVQIIPDNAPTLSVEDLTPDTPVKGGLAYQSIVIKDGWTVNDDPLQYFGAYTSLQGLGNGDIRGSPLGKVATQGTGQDATHSPYMELPYTEASAIPGTVFLGAKTYLKGGDDRLQVWPFSQPAADGLLKVDFGPNYSVTYHVVLLKQAGCSSHSEDFTVEDPAGVKWADISGGDIVSAEIGLQVTDAAGNPVDTFIKKLRVDAKDLEHAGPLSTLQGSRRLLGEPIVTAFIKDGDNTAFLAATSNQKVSGPSGRHSTAIRIPVDYDIKNVLVLAHGIDRFSAARGDQVLPVTALRKVTADEEPPQVTVTAPANGVPIVPMQRFDLKITADDNAGGVKSIKVFENRSKLIFEAGGVYNVTTYTVPYEVPADYTGGELELLVEVEDQSGATATQLLSFPVHENEPPELTLKKFAFYKVGGVYKKVYDTAERLNYGEFWIRVGEEFRLDTALADDAGLTEYGIYRKQRDGQLVEEYHATYDADCPQPSITKKSESAAIVFNQPEPTEYLIVAKDNTGNETTRTILVHPLMNMAPEIRITSPAQDQLIRRRHLQN